MGFTQVTASLAGDRNVWAAKAMFLLSSVPVPGGCRAAQAPWVNPEYKADVKDVCKNGSDFSRLSSWVRDAALSHEVRKCHQGCRGKGMSTSLDPASNTAHACPLTQASRGHRTSNTGTLHGQAGEGTST